MSTAEYFWHLAEQAIGVLVVGLPATILLMAPVGFVGFELVKNRALSFSVILWSLFPGLVPYLILIYGAAFRMRGPSVRAELLSTEIAPILILIASCALVGALIAWRVPKARWLVVTATAMFVWWSLAAGFVSSMAVTGDWL